jgi:hypothetical protein
MAVSKCNVLNTIQPLHSLFEQNERECFITACSEAIVPELGRIAKSPRPGEFGSQEVREKIILSGIILNGSAPAV